MPGIDRSTDPEVLVRFRAEFDLAQEGLGRDFGLSLATVQRYEHRGAPRWMSYAMVGWSIVEGRVAPEELRPLWEGRLHLSFRRWPQERNAVERWRSVFAARARSEMLPNATSATETSNTDGEKIGQKDPGWRQSLERIGDKV